MSSEQFLSEFRDHLRAGFGGLAVKTVESYDFANFLAERQSYLGAAVLRMRPGCDLRAVSDGDNLISVPAIANLGDLAKSIPQWKRAVCEQLSSVFTEIRRLDLGETELGLPGLCQSYTHGDSVEELMHHMSFVVILQNVVSEDLLKNTAMIEYLQRGAYEARLHGVTLVVQTSLPSLGVTLSPYYPLMEFGRPDRKEILGIIKPLVSERYPDLDDATYALIVESCRGLTRRQVEDICSLLICQREASNPEKYKQVKIQHAEQEGLFEVMKFRGRHDQLFGLEGMIKYTEPLLEPCPMTDEDDFDSKDMQSRGLLFIGPSGSGKTEAASELARRSGRTLCNVDLGKLRRKFVGETEERVSQMLEMVESLAPAILLVDEVDKAFDGVQSSGETDGGLGGRILKKFLTWAQDHPEDVILLFTANNITKITDNFPEMLRSERFDGMFMFDLPQEKARFSIWKSYMERFGVQGDASELAEESINRTGAEIRSCCRMAKKRKARLSDQFELTSSVYRTSGHVVEAVREFADGKFIDAATGKIYKKDRCEKKTKISSRRKIKPSDN